MNLSTVKWAQWDKTQSRELLGLFICVCIALCAIVAHNIAQNKPDNFPSSLQTITIAPMMSIWGKGVDNNRKMSHNVIAYHMSSAVFRVPPAGGDMIQQHHCYEAAETQQQSSRLYVRHLRNSTRLLIIKQTSFKNKQNITMAKILLLQHNQHFLPWRFGLYQRPSSEEVCAIPLPVLATIVMRRGKYRKRNWTNFFWRRSLIETETSR